MCATRREKKKGTWRKKDSLKKKKRKEEEKCRKKKTARGCGRKINLEKKKRTCFPGVAVTREEIGG